MTVLYNQNLQIFTFCFYILIVSAEFALALIERKETKQIVCKCEYFLKML